MSLLLLFGSAATVTASGTASVAASATATATVAVGALASAAASATVAPSTGVGGLAAATAQGSAAASIAPAGAVAASTTTATGAAAIATAELIAAAQATATAAAATSAPAVVALSAATPTIGEAALGIGGMVPLAGAASAAASIAPAGAVAAIVATATASAAGEVYASGIVDIVATATVRPSVAVPAMAAVTAGATTSASIAAQALAAGTAVMTVAPQLGVGGLAAASTASAAGASIAVPVAPLALTASATTTAHIGIAGVVPLEALARAAPTIAVEGTVALGAFATIVVTAPGLPLPLQAAGLAVELPAVVVAALEVTERPDELVVSGTLAIDLLAADAATVHRLLAAVRAALDGDPRWTGVVAWSRERGADWMIATEAYAGPAIGVRITYACEWPSAWGTVAYAEDVRRAVAAYLATSARVTTTPSREASTLTALAGVLAAAAVPVIRDPDRPVVGPAIAWTVTDTERLEESLGLALHRVRVVITYVVPGEDLGARDTVTAGLEAVRTALEAWRQTGGCLDVLADETSTDLHIETSTGPVTSGILRVQIIYVAADVDPYAAAA